METESKRWDALMSAAVAVMRDIVADPDNQVSTPEEREYIVSLMADAGDRMSDLIKGLARDYSQIYWYNHASDLGRPTDRESRSTLRWEELEHMRCTDCGFQFTAGLTNEHSCESERTMREHAREREIHAFYHDDPNCHASHSNSSRCEIPREPVRHCDIHVVCPADCDYSHSETPDIPCPRCATYVEGAQS